MRQQRSPSTQRRYQFETLEQAQQIIGEFITRYNTQWLIERLGYRTPAQVRAEAQRPRAA